MSMAELIQKLKERWGVTTGWQLILILFIFSISGMTVLYVKKGAFSVLGFDDQTAFWLKAVTWVLVVFPSYQVIFLFYGFIFGQYEFAKNFLLHSLERIKGLFSKSG